MSFLFFFTHSGRSLLGGLAEGQLAVVFASGSSIWSEGIQLGWETGINRGSGLTNTACDAGGF